MDKNGIKMELMSEQKGLTEKKIIEKRTTEKGLGLIDILIGIALSLTLTLGILSLFNITRQSLILSNAISTLLENANVAYQSFKKIAVLAGHKAPTIAHFRGCYRSNRPSFGDNLNNFAFAGDLGWGVGGSTISGCINNVYNYYSSSGSFFPSFGMLWGGYCVINAVQSPFRFGPLKNPYPQDSLCTTGDAVAVYQFIGVDYPRLSVLGPLTTFGLANDANLSINFQGQAEHIDGSLRNVLQDCVGNTVDKFAVVQNNFKLDTTTNILSCTSMTEIVSTGNLTEVYGYLWNSSPTTSAPKNVISNVKAMEVLFASGLYALPGLWQADGIQKGYVKPTDFNSVIVNNIPTWNFMQSYNLGVQISLLLQSDNNVITVKDTKTYKLLTGTYGPFNDNRLRRVITMTLKTNETCIPENLPGCNGAPFMATINEGMGFVNRVGGTIRQNESIPVRAINNYHVCAEWPHYAVYSCRMDASGNFGAEFSCNTKTVSNFSNYVGTGFYPFSTSNPSVSYGGINNIISCTFGIM